MNVTDVLREQNGYETYGQREEAVRKEETPSVPRGEKEEKPYGHSSMPEEQNVVYDRKTLAQMCQEDNFLRENMLSGLTECSKMPCFRTKEDMERASEIYGISVYGGKVHVSGGDGYHDKARAYEKLLNASLGCQFRWSHGRVANEDAVLRSLTDMFHYYSAYDEKIYQANHKDSIANHVGEAFESWTKEYKPSRTHFAWKI